ARGRKWCRQQRGRPLSATYDLIFRGGAIANHDGVGRGDVPIRDGRSAALGDLPRADRREIVDVTGLHILTGVVASHVHLRESGNEYKEDLETGGRAAVLGGVTTVFEMPNTKPPTTSPEALADKVARARHCMYCDFAFYGGATTENVDLLAAMEREPGCC